MKRDLLKFVDGAAELIDGAMVRMLGTGTPTLREVKELVIKHDVQLEPVYGDRSFKAELILDSPFAYRIRYNATQLPIIQMLQIYHELCELVAIKHHPGLFDDDPSVSVYAFDGGANPSDMRHLAALKCEDAMIRRLNASGYAVPKSVVFCFRERTSVRNRVPRHESGRCNCGCRD